MADEVGKQAELPPGQQDLAPIPQQALTGQVELQPLRDGEGADALAEERQRVTPQERPETSVQLVDVGPRGEHVVGAGLEKLDALGLGWPLGEDGDEHGAPPPQRTAQIDELTRFQHRRVEHEQVEATRGGRRDQPPRVGGHVHPVARGTQQPGELAVSGRVGIGDQKAHRRVP